MPQIKFIYFDIGGVIADYIAAFKKLSQRLNVPEQTFIDLFHQHVDQIDRGSMTWTEFEKIAYQELKIEKKLEKPLCHYFTSYFSAITPTHQLIKEIKDKYQIGILSNIPQEVFEQLVEKFFIPKVKFDSIVISAEISKIKPEKEIFDYALSKTNLPAKEVLFIDDKKENTDAAKKYGWNTISFDTQNPGKSVEEIRKMIS